MILQPRPGRRLKQPVIVGERAPHDCVAAEVFWFLDKDGVKDAQCRKRGLARRNEQNTLPQMSAVCHVHVRYMCKKKQACHPTRDWNGIDRRRDGESLEVDGRK